VTRCLYRVELADGTSQLALGDTDAGPLELVAHDLSIAGLLKSGGDALGDVIAPPFAIRLTIRRAGTLVFDGATSTDRLRRSPDDLVGHLVQAMSFPTGAILLTGTGIVPDPPFSLSVDDTVTIAIDGLGRLENPVVQVGASG
jgi:hypothetical protein